MDVVRGQFGVVGEDGGFVEAAAEPSEDVPDRDAGSADDGLAGTNLRIHGDTD